MSEQQSDFAAEIAKTAEGAQALIGRLFEVAEPGAIFSEPFELQDIVIINAAEVIIGAGTGFGGGSGPAPGPTEDEPDQAAMGMGGGGGGFSHGRPVAAIVIGPGGVEVKPIVDTTKIGIAFLTTLAAMGISALQIARALRKAD